MFVFCNIHFFQVNLEEDAQLLEAGDGGEGEAGHLLAEQHPLVAPARTNSLLQSH